MTRNRTYSPKRAVPPGEIIREYIASISMPQRELAMRMGRPAEQISRLINAHIRLTAETALQLERVLGRPAHFWMNLENNYRLFLARRGRR